MRNFWSCVWAVASLAAPAALSGASGVEPAGVEQMAPGDTCVAATHEVGPLPYNPPASTTVAAVDDYNLPADLEAPTCTAPTSCTGSGPGSSLPRGAVFAGTGTGPDRAYRIRTDQSCDLTITLDPTAAEDLALIVYQGSCSNSLGDCVCVDDSDIGGVAESVVLSAVAGVDYFLVVDGYSTGAVPPGPSGPFTLSIAGTGCELVGLSPDIAVEPTSLSSTQPPDTQEELLFDIDNVGGGSLSWSTQEAPGGALASAAARIAGGCGTEVPWLSVDPVSGTTPAGESSTVTVTLDSTGLATGLYEASVCVASDDPDEALVVVDVAMTVDTMPFLDGFESGDTTRWSSTSASS